METTDPTELAGYDYAGNDPVTGSDPTGKMRAFPADIGGGGGSSLCSSYNAQGLGGQIGCSNDDAFQKPADRHNSRPATFGDVGANAKAHLIAFAWSFLGNGFASQLLGHYLDNSGTDLNIHQRVIYQDNPRFADSVNSLMLGAMSQGDTFSSQWTRFNFDPKAGTPGFDGLDPAQRDEAWAFGKVNLKVSGSIGPSLGNGDRLVTATIQFDSTYQFRTDSPSGMLASFARLNTDGLACPFHYRVFQTVQFALAPNGQVTPYYGSDPTQAHPWDTGPINSGTPTPAPTPSPAPLPAPTP